MPMNPADYPRDWPAISKRIRAERAGGRCECRGQCGRLHHAPAALENLAAHDIEPGERCGARNGEAHPVTGSRVVLTVAHLDHDTQHCADENLLALCQRCHLAYDAELHRRNAHATRRGRRALGDLFAGAADPNLERT